MITAEFSFTYDDCVDISERTLRRFIAQQRPRAVGAALVGFIAVGLMYYLLRSLGSDTGWLIVVFAVVTGLDYVSRPARARWRLRRLLRKRYGGAGPFHCIVTADDIGITFVQDDGTFAQLWPEVGEISNTPDGVEIVSRRLGVSMVRARAFATPQAQAEFAAYCSDRRAAAPRGAGVK